VYDPTSASYFSFRYSLDAPNAVINMWGVQGEETSFNLIVLIATSAEHTLYAQVMRIGIQMGRLVWLLNGRLNLVNKREHEKRSLN
jgi:hypothetical protein